MVRIREARRAYRRFHAACFWSFDPEYRVGSADIDWVIDGLRKNGNREAWEVAARLCRATARANQPGYLRAIVEQGSDRTKLEWAHDSAWRFLPAHPDPDVGYRLHPIDIAVNKVLALAGRDEPRDFLDILYINDSILPLGPLCWAAAGKDPGFSPRSLLELLKRRGRYRPEDFAALRVTGVVDVRAMKQQWLAMLDAAERFIENAPPNQVGCLYYSTAAAAFVDPTAPDTPDDVEPHYGRPGGVLPRFLPDEPFPKRRDS